MAGRRPIAAPLDRPRARVSFQAILALAVAILSEVAGTSALKASDSFTRPLPAAMTVVCYGLAFYTMSIAIRTIPVGIVYAIWSGVGIVLISVIGWFVFGEKLDAAALVGLGFIIVGVALVQGHSASLRP